MKRYMARCAFAAAVAATWLPGTARSQTPPVSAPTPTTAPARVPQPQELLQLAEKARKLRSVHIRGKGVVDDPDAKLPAELKEFRFEIWAVPPACKTALEIPSREVRVCDGKYAYTYREAPAQAPRAQRRRVTQAGFYRSLGLAAVVVDATSGYANLTASVKFVPIPAPAAYEKQVPGLKWFRLESAARTPHYLLRDASSVRIGISPADGLVRVLTARLKVKEPQPTATVFFETVRLEQVDPRSLKLPAAAGKAKWTDADTGKEMPVPRGVLSAPKP